MTSFKTIAVTAIIAVAGTMAAFGGLHLGQSGAAAATTAQPSKANVNYTVTLSAKQLATLMHGQQQSATHRVRTAHHPRQATHRSGGYRSTSRSYTRSGGSYSHRSGNRGSYRCYNYGRGGGNWGGGSSGSRSGGSWGGGCW